MLFWSHPNKFNREFNELKSFYFAEAGLFAIRSEREYVMDEDFMKAVRKVAENKKLETKLDYKPV